MVNYTVEYAPAFCGKYLSKLSKDSKERIKKFIEVRISVDPFSCGKELKGNLAGMWSTRCGHYRIIYIILEEKVVIQIIKIDHRKDVYL